MSITPYLYDAYPLAGTLSALTAAACFRLVCAGLLPLGVVIVRDLRVLKRICG